MASNENEDRFQCSKCNHFLDLESKTLRCLHSFCRPCVEVIVGGNGSCPQCQQTVTGDELRLAPFLVKALIVRHMESGEWHCEFCSEDGIESAGQIWCHGCQKLLCQNCNRSHKELESTHNWEDLSGLARDEAIRVMTMDDCRRHRKSKDSFCERCNLCLCEACYADHVIASPQCPPRPLSVGEEASKEKERGPTLERQLRELEIRIRAANEKTRRSIDELSTDCEAECSKVWNDFEAFVEGARHQLSELCENMRQATSERVRKWRHSLNERDDLLKKVKVWRQASRRLLRDDAKDGDVVCGLRLMGAELSSWFRQSFAPAEKGQFVVTFPKWCHDSLESLKKESIHLTAQTFDGHLQLETECRLQESKPVSLILSRIYSIVADDEDNHVFLCNWNGGSIQEFDESGELVDQCHLRDGGEGFHPTDMCRLSKDILVVCCPWGFPGFPGVPGPRLFFMGRQKCRPFLKIEKIIDTKQNKFFSLCQKDKKIFACERNFEKIVCFNENGEELKTIQIRGSTGGTDDPLLRVDPTTGNLWGGRKGGSEISVWDQNGQILQNLKLEEEICDFCSNEFGFFYFSNQEGIFSVLPKKVLYKFGKKSQDFPRIFVSRQKLFCFFKNDGKNFLKIFKIN